MRGPHARLPWPTPCLPEGCHGCSVTSRRPSRAWPGFVCLTIALLAGLVAFTASAGVVDSMPVASAVALAASGATAWWWTRGLTLAAYLAGVPTTFRMAFTARRGGRPRPARRARLHHRSQCRGVAGHVVAAVAGTATSAPAATGWRPRGRPAYRTCTRAGLSAGDPARCGAAPEPGPFFVDVFEYPPTFLPLPRLLALVTTDFWGFRRLWFALNLAGVVIGLVAIAHRIDTSLGTHALWLTPWALAAPSIIGTLQVGNVQLLFLVISATAMLLFERGRLVSGGLLLGYAIASKLFPGVLVLFLLLRRDWRAVAWTATAGVALTAIALADVGWTPFAAFLEHLPKILSGEAFPGLFRAPAIAINESIPGLVFKLTLWGVPGMGFPQAQVVGWIYTLVLVAAIVWLARRRSDRRLDPLIWIAILILATLRSPFLPSYGAFPALWLAALLTAVAWPRRDRCCSSWHCGCCSQSALGRAPSRRSANAALTLSHTIASILVVILAWPSDGSSNRHDHHRAPSVPLRRRAAAAAACAGVVGFTLSAGIRDDMALATVVVDSARPPARPR